MSTGWLAPVYVTTWNSGLTDGLSAASICEAEYAFLALNRPRLGEQATVFLQAIKDVCKRLKLEIKIERRQTLQLVACAVPVASTLSWCGLPASLGL